MIIQEVLDVIIEPIYNTNQLEKHAINYFLQTKKKVSKFKKYGNFHTIIQPIMYY